MLPVFPARPFDGSLRMWLLAVAVLLPLVWGQGLLAAQAPPTQDPSAGGEKQEIPKPKDVSIQTTDGVALAATYFPGLKEKESVPVVLLHELRGRYQRGGAANTRFSRVDYAGLAKYLQARGHAVLVPDLRGHGDSNVRKIPGRADQVIDPETMGGPDYQRMVAIDMPTLKNYLIARNNEGELNIEKLVVVGAEESALLAMYWTQLDWSIPASGNQKQGQDIKAVILLSPKWSVPGLQWGQISRYQPLAMIPFDPQLQRVFRDGVRRDPRQGAVVFDYRREVPVRILVGWYESKNPADKPPTHVREAMADARKVHNLLKGVPDADALLGKFDTKTQGTALLQVPGLRCAQIIANLVDKTVGSRRLSWEKRVDPYRGNEDR